MTSSLQTQKYRPLFSSSTLHLVNPPQSSLKSPVTVDYRLDKTDLLVSFFVNTPVLYKKEVYTPGIDYPYEFDVVEVFLTFDDVAASCFSYFEYELTPLGQTYHLRLDVKEGTRLSEELPKIPTQASMTDRSWEAHFRIPLESFGQTMDLAKLKGNFYAILGETPRTYWSSFLPQQNKANFHKPEFFKNLFECI